MKELIDLSKKAIECALEKKELIVDEELKEKFKEKKACFVTLTLDGDLRGCIGYMAPRQELYKEVVENSINAALYDSRFYPLTKDEFDKIKIEISVLGDLKKIDYKDKEDLKKKIFNKGVLIQKSYNSATYLPQVWESFEGVEDFLNSLCLKAGLNSNVWKKEKIDVFVYDVFKICE